MMKNYVIYSVARTGSMLYADLLGGYYNCSICRSAHNLTPDWNCPIQHTHQLAVFKQAPRNFVRLFTTRSIFESVVSMMVAEQTKVWHINGQENLDSYRQTYNNFQVTIDPTRFSLIAKRMDYEYTDAHMVYDQYSGEKHTLSYNTHAINFDNFFQELGINYHYNPADFPVIQKMPVNKISMIGNLDEIITVYKSLDLCYHNDSDDFFDNLLTAQ